MEKNFDHIYYGRSNPDMAASITDHTDLDFARLKALCLQAELIIDIYPHDTTQQDHYFLWLNIFSKFNDKYIRDYLSSVTDRDSQLWLQFEPGCDAPFLHITINKPVIESLGDPKQN